MAKFKNRYELGDDLYRFTDQGPDGYNQECLITAHGLQKYSLHKPMGIGGPTIDLYYYAKHNRATRDIGIAAFTKKLGRVVEVCNQANSPDYMLSKYNDSDYNPNFIRRHNKMGEKYADIDYAAGYHGMDIITVRNRNFANIIYLSTVIKTLQQHGFYYYTIHCSFCRGFI